MARKSGLTAKAIEKEWWVTLTLKALFESPYAKFFIFKGGTSLSKGWKIIERFSEDIDIALDPMAFGKAYQNDPSHNFVKTLKREDCAFTSNELRYALAIQLIHLGVPKVDISIIAEDVSEVIPDKDPQTLFVRYRSLYPSHGYIADEVKVEFSVRSLRDPFQKVLIQSILSEAFPNPAYGEVPFEVLVTEPQKTLLEKAFLLHEKFVSSKIGKVQIERLSRHLYDLVKLMDSSYSKKVVKDIGFYTTLIEHRKNYIRLRDVDYATLNPETINFIPSREQLEIFREDYKSLQTAMIYGISPDFETVIQQLKILTGRFRLLNEFHELGDIIMQAEANIENSKDFQKEGTLISVPVRYHTDIYKPEGSKNKTISYQVHFIQEQSKFVFDFIEIIPSTT